MSNLAHTVRRSVLLDAPPDEVWEAVRDESIPSEWLAPEVELVEEAERLAFRWQREGTAPPHIGLAGPAAELSAGCAPRLASLPLAVGRLTLA